MANYANQITVHIENFKNIQHITGKEDGVYCPPILWRYRKQAMLALTGNGYKLWDYFLSWGGTTSFSLSPKHIEQEIGISNKGVYNARKELEQKRYLRQDNNVIYFYPDGTAP